MTSTAGGPNAHAPECLVSDTELALGTLKAEQDTTFLVGGRSRRACFLAGRPGSTLVELPVNQHPAV